jgi:hypothetical protein
MITRVTGISTGLTKKRAFGQKRWAFDGHFHRKNGHFDGHPIKTSKNV